MKAPRFFIIMGVAGSGKTTIGRALAAALGWEFYDGDDFHPPENIAKMAAGIPLDDVDRLPWLYSLRDIIASRLNQERALVLACSALKERYRQILLSGNEGGQVVYLKGSYELIHSRMVERSGHFMKPELLQSQFETLEEPINAVIVDVSRSVDEIVSDILATCFVP
ncbi:gluconokinase [uncultured Thermanaerothrix sp.]|uniref:gluconokinase n=1 Tax=uncultured Thermanaerothrix sp. TaxID=1195149 RepID=UPI002601BF44|nr:gluconokinase [uncultured Thermanaerothrix sp.]